MSRTIASSFGSYGAADYGLDERVVTADVATHAESGAILGGLLGAAVGLGASLMGFTVSGAGAIGAASPMLMALTGAAVGAIAGGLIGALTEGIDHRVSRWRDSGWTAGRASALPNSPEEAERERRQFGTHADALTGLPLTADPELDNVLETTIRR
jgi:hypothetical protein